MVFNKHMMILGTMEDKVNPEQVTLNLVPFLVQMHNLSVGYMTETVGRNVGNYVGGFLEYDEKNNSYF